MQKIYVVTMWSGGRAARRWTSHEKPNLLKEGTGVDFVNDETKLPVSVIGSISVEEYESGKEEIERIMKETVAEGAAAKKEDGGGERLNLS